MLEYTLFDVPPYFDGRETYEPSRDQRRLGKQLLAVKNYMLTHEWVSLRQLALAVGGSEQGVSARLRDLRKARFGAYVVERKRVEGAVFLYRVKR